MSTLEYRKPVTDQPHHDQLGILQETLQRLETGPEKMPQIADLKRILVGRIGDRAKQGVMRGNLPTFCIYFGLYSNRIVIR